MHASTLIVRHLGQQAYVPCWRAMQDFTQQRDDNTLDEIWLLEHDPVFTQGQNGKPEHIIAASQIPIVATDRGGQVTYHGPGQLMLYTLINLKRKKMQVRDYVCALEKSVIELLKQAGIAASGKREAPGVYTLAEGKKICSIGLRVRRGYAYHGIALNVAMDLSPFQLINPCGFSGLKMTQLADCAPDFLAQIQAMRPQEPLLQHIGKLLIEHLMQQFSYTTATYLSDLRQAI